MKKLFMIRHRSGTTMVKKFTSREQANTWLRREGKQRAFDHPFWEVVEVQDES